MSVKKWIIEHYQDFFWHKEEWMHAQKTARNSNEETKANQVYQNTQEKLKSDFELKKAAFILKEKLKGTPQNKAEKVWANLAFESYQYERRMYAYQKD